VWECDPLGVNAAVARPAMGKFQHEAVAVDPVNGQLYLTEDRSDGGFYRFTPDAYPDLSTGLLEVMTEVGGTLGWAAVEDPDGSPVATRDQVADMKLFNGGEGIWYRPDFVAFSTKGDNKIWMYIPASNILSVLYDDNTSPTPVLSGVDNVTLPAVPGATHVFVCEDGGNMEVVAVDIETGGQNAFVFCRITGRSGSEVTGAAFSPDGTRLYFSSQRNPGETFEVTGPFRSH
jgi:secreted PhoX family phosphatase